MDYIAPNDRMIINDELRRMRKESVMAYFVHHRGFLCKKTTKEPQNIPFPSRHYKLVHPKHEARQLHVSSV